MKRKAENFHIAWSFFLLLALCLHPAQTRAASTPGVLSAPGTAGVVTSGTSGVVNSKHDLGVRGPGSIKAKAERGVCIFCHTPHGGMSQTPLWNHRTSKASYLTYSSSTMIAKVGQPNGASKLCLGCHDGTIAIGMVNMGNGGKVISLQHSVTVLSGSGNLGTNLSRDHPISFTFNSALAAKQGKLCDPSTLTENVRLDSNSQVQCTSCHDPHNNQYGNFLVMDNAGSALCTTCHTDPLWSESAHHLSNLPITGATSKLLAPSGSKTSAKTVGANACDNCHQSHNAAGRQQLLRTAVEYQTCFACHGGTIARQNIEAQFKKLSVHPLMQTSKISNPGQSFISGTRQVLCSDCHDSHAAKKLNAVAPQASGPILGVAGVTRSGSITNSITYEYELCFRCHGDNAVRSSITVNRVALQPNMRMAFSTSNGSYHPVVGIGKNSKVPSLLAPYTVASVIKCTDCHNNDQGPGAGGSGPAGPHGSAYAPLLERQLITTDYVGESLANNALCYKCHSRNSILSDQSFRAFNSQGQESGHRFHIVDQKAACTTCHDSHGAATNAHLINFNPDYVTPSSTRIIQYTSLGPFRGTCTLTCHGFDHVNATYPQLIIQAAHAKAKPRTAPTSLLPRTTTIRRLF